MYTYSNCLQLAPDFQITLKPTQLIPTICLFHSTHPMLKTLGLLLLHLLFGHVIIPYRSLGKLDILAEFILLDLHTFLTLRESSRSDWIKWWFTLGNRFNGCILFSFSLSISWCDNLSNTETNLSSHCLASNNLSSVLSQPYFLSLLTFFCEKSAIAMPLLVGATKLLSRVGTVSLGPLLK